MDVVSYLLINSKRDSRWRCPICKARVFWDELYIDTRIVRVLEEVKKKYRNCEDVEIQMRLDGSWEDRLVQPDESQDRSDSEDEKKVAKKPSPEKPSPPLADKITEVGNLIVTLQKQSTQCVTHRIGRENDRTKGRAETVAADGRSRPAGPGLHCIAV